MVALLNVFVLLRSHQRRYLQRFWRIIVGEEVLRTVQQDLDDLTLIGHVVHHALHVVALAAHDGGTEHNGQIFGFHFVDLAFLHHSTQMQHDVFESFVVVRRQTFHQPLQLLKTFGRVLDFGGVNEAGVQLHGYQGVGHFSEVRLKYAADHVDVVPLLVVHRYVFVVLVDFVRESGNGGVVARHSVNAHDLQSFLFHYGGAHVHDFGDERVVGGGQTLFDRYAEG